MALESKSESKSKEAAKEAPAEEPAEAPAEEASEPEKDMPAKGSDAADTPSGAALLKSGAPNPEEAGSDAERERGEKYAAAKHQKRWYA